ncbi:glutathione S-transferase [Rhodoferax saidenbachensis]|uniref:Glutathione S-transferase n=1 Tax=Rhodoferax saidenbachensis TaxID=1484693 RepID=A0ABU1ZKR6_9BURK|nr:glutathione S-transferase [Rhodoferax saidenbachensis]MDR7306132.1 glutathione S-transferase [Rhodoferax saidenbachensis]
MSTLHPTTPIRLHRMPLSGHCHRVELFLSLLGLPVELVEVNMAAGAHKAPAFLQLNPFGQVPVIQDGDVTLADSNAILVYLASRYAPDADAWLPRDPLQAAAVQRWLSVAAGPLAFGAAVARAIVVFKRATQPEEAIQRAHSLLAVMEATLQHTNYLTGDRPTLADIANYSYTAHAPEGRVTLDASPHVRAWLARIEALPGFVPMVKTPLPQAA